jgi:tetratricopeptide (TPR) repeat protein
LTPLPSSSTEIPPGTLLGRWEVLYPRGRGGMATVYVARDAESQELRAVKVMNPGGSADEVERRFRREFRTLSRLQHPNITQVYDWGTHNGRPYFVMELVEGQDLRALVENWMVDPDPERFEVARSVVIQVARALEYVHLRGLVHRDVTPSNVMVLPDGTVKLMDFGVVKESGVTDLTAHGELLGTVAYIAPEQINGERIDARTDLYSLGAVLYLLLTGRRPFNARTLAGYLDKHLHRPPRPPRELVAAVPRALEDVCLRLLQKDPADRFASASHLLHVLEGADHRPFVANTAWPPAIVARADAIAAITNGLAAARDGQGGVILLDGAAGSGKSRLCELAMEQARRAGMPANRIRARPSANPLAAYVAVYQALRAEGIAARPALERGLGPSAEGAVQVERYALFAAFREMVAGTRPRLFCVDDLHFADAGSIELLEYLVRNTLNLGKEPILWLLTRTPGVADAAIDGLALGSRTEVPPTHIALDALDASAVEELVLSLVVDTPGARALARRLQREGEGNPAFIAEMLRGLLEEGVIATRDGERVLTLDDAGVARATLPLPRSVREAVLRRMEGLPAIARRVADMLAVARQELTTALLCEMAELPEADVLAGVDALIEAGLVRERHVEMEEHVDFTQPRLRELLGAVLPADEKTRLHRRLGEALERTYRRRLNLVVEPLAAHFELGGVPGKAYAYLVRAGQRLLDRSFVAEAEGFFSRAIVLEPAARATIVLDEADRQLADLLLRRADALAHLGRWAEVPEGLATADRLAGELGDDRLQSRAAAALGAMARHGHDHALAESRLGDALRLAERAGDASLRVMPLNGLAALAWARGDLESARRWWVEELAVGEATRDERSLGYGYNGLGLVALCKGQSVEARRFFEQSAEIFERMGLLGPLAVARVNLVEIHHFTGNLRRGLELAEKTIATARETDHPLGLARGRHHKALVLVDLGRYGQAMEEAREALHVVRQLDQKDDEVATLVGLLRAAWALHDYEELRRGLDEAVELLPYDPEGFAPIVYAWRARLAASQGDATGAQDELERALGATCARWPYQECRLDLVLARTYVAMGNIGEATRRAESAIRRADACGFRLYALKGHGIAAQHSTDEAAVARHRRVADALARSLAANLSREDAERFLDQPPPATA